MASTALRCQAACSACRSHFLSAAAAVAAGCRYVWGACSTRPTNAHNSLAKFDTHTKAVQVRGLGAGAAPCRLIDWLSGCFHFSV